MEKILEFVGAVVLVLGLVLGLAALLAFPTKWMVNYLITPNCLVAVFGVPALTFWRALALNTLCGMLFSGSKSASKAK